MTRRRLQPQEDGGDQKWMVTFSDCMTLLLTFFVMLLAFSSFDPQILASLAGPVESPNNPAVFDNPRRPAPSPEEPVDRPVDWTEEGAEKPTDLLRAIQRPREPLDALDAGAYADRRVVTVPSDLLFWGRGNRLRPEADEILRAVTQYLRLMACRVVVAETSAADARPTPEAAEARAASRALAVVDRLTADGQVDRDRFCIAIADPGDEAEPVVRIQMLDHGVYP